ncbi:hypothetical protein VOLCADRAFT_90001 [Volvox carteri f. nagariensis]|uniref:Uncharacterized protein n=1 Tax=Volvox carteri f. nagariensis TaxID=3068 RepID=D8TT82_VOLCA|nr:uncharacterized protein VOLCADRAFT_90001 [Volvox carteri f. nagariensis]EFJ49263.1 hypothetical protein VOLCADRAFT_90001 [Volvox carteri f. nagariensis]|eukprot:XP_002949711.1 hypothetical protein VOLCADRAFT_90001 [Volvox carteri f. nagariensis]
MVSEARANELQNLTVPKLSITRDGSNGRCGAVAVVGQLWTNKDDEMHVEFHGRCTHVDTPYQSQDGRRSRALTKFCIDVAHTACEPGSKPQTLRGALLQVLSRENPDIINCGNTALQPSVDVIRKELAKQQKARTSLWESSPAGSIMGTVTEMQAIMAARHADTLTPASKKKAMHWNLLGYIFHVSTVPAQVITRTLEAMSVYHALENDLRLAVSPVMIDSCSNLTGTPVVLQRVHHVETNAAVFETSLTELAKACRLVRGQGGAKLPPLIFTDDCKATRKGHAMADGFENIAAQLQYVRAEMERYEQAIKAVVAQLQPAGVYQYTKYPSAENDALFTWLALLVTGQTDLDGIQVLTLQPVLPIVLQDGGSKDNPVGSPEDRADLAAMHGDALAKLWRRMVDLGVTFKVVSELTMIKRPTVMAGKVVPSLCASHVVRSRFQYPLHSPLFASLNKAGSFFAHHEYGPFLIVRPGTAADKKNSKQPVYVYVFPVVLTLTDKVFEVRRYRNDVAGYEEACEEHSDDLVQTLLSSELATSTVPNGSIPLDEESTIVEPLPAKSAAVGVGVQVSNPLFFVVTRGGKQMVPLVMYWTNLRHDLLVSSPLAHTMFPSLDRVRDTAITLPRSITWRTTGGVEAVNNDSSASKLGFSGKPRPFPVMLTVLAAFDRQHGRLVLADLMAAGVPLAKRSSRSLKAMQHQHWLNNRPLDEIRASIATSSKAATASDVMGDSKRLAVHMDAWLLNVFCEAPLVLKTVGDVLVRWGVMDPTGQPDAANAGSSRLNWHVADGSGAGMAVGSAAAAGVLPHAVGASLQDAANAGSSRLNWHVADGSGAGMAVGSAAAAGVLPHVVGASLQDAANAGSSRLNWHVADGSGAGMADVALPVINKSRMEQKDASPVEAGLANPQKQGETYAVGLPPTHITHPPTMLKSIHP